MIAEITKEIVKQSKPVKKPYEIRDTELKGFLLRVQPSGVKSYICQYGHHQRITIGRTTYLTPLQAREKARKILADHVMTGRDPQMDRRLSKMNTLEEFIAEKYHDWAKANLKSASETLRKISTFYPALRGKKLAEITAWLIEKQRTARLKDVSASTANRELDSLRAALSKAVQWGILQENPTEAVKRTKVDAVARVRYLTNEESKRLHEALDKREERRRHQRDAFNEWRESRGYNVFPNYGALTDHLKPLVLTALNTGLRRGELFNLKWPDIDFGIRILTIIGKTAKSSQTRHVPLNDAVYGVLSQWRSQSEGDGYVFPGRDGGRMDNVSTSWARLMKDAKIRNFRFHDCRHDFASQLVMACLATATSR
jgi:integrase